MPASPLHPLCAARLPILAFGLILPLTVVGAASADPRAWVDPPARPVAAPDAPKAPAATTADDGLPDDGLPKAAATPAANLDRTVAQTTSAPTAKTTAVKTTAVKTGRLADTQALGDVRAVSTSRDRATAARALAVAYLETVSAPGAAMVGAAPRFYGAQVRFYGRPTTLAALIAQKRSFVRRWPERRYEARTIGSTCEAERCTVRAIVDFRAANAGRGAVSRGAAELVLEVRFSGSRPVIVAETGRVLRRGAQAGTLAPARGRA